MRRTIDFGVRDERNGPYFAERCTLESSSQVHTTDGHIICFSWTATEHRESITEFIRDGLRYRAAVCVLSHTLDIPSILDDLAQEGESITAGKESGQIVVLSAQEILANRCDMTPKKVLAWVRGRHLDAAAKGFPTFWLTVEMTWALQYTSEDERLTGLEAALSRLATEIRATIASRYDLSRVDTGRLTRTIRTAKKIELGRELVDNPYYTPSEDLAGPKSRQVLFNQMLEHIKDKRARDTLLDNENLLRALFREIDVGFVLFEVFDKGEELFDFVAVQGNPVIEEINDLATGGVIGKNALELFPTQKLEIIDVLSEVALTGSSARFEQFKADTKRTYEVIAFRPKQELCAALITDITERKRFEEVKQRSEFRIRQAQKMEAVGRLAGGVAHDFNNILTAIVALSNVLLEEIPEGSSQWCDANEIRKAAERAGALTKQLLAFSRKQKIAPQVLNLNQVIEDSRRLLSRMIGEDVQLVFSPDEALMPVTFDPNQMEQILANFAANARDAMPQGGELLIETANVALAEPQLTPHGEVCPGNYVRLRVTDDGIGMSEEIQERIFEPFFTTKGTSRGTGLGLATVYGIVRQNNGAIFVRSTPGEGSTFEIFLPPAASVVQRVTSNAPVAVAAGSGTILLAEDEETVRNLTRRVLKRNGYEVISAASGEEAQLLFESEGFRVDLLITDVVMPGMDGVQLADELTRRKPGLKVILMSGYPEDVLAEHGVLPATPFLEKPFSPERLIVQVQRLIKDS